MKQSREQVQIGAKQVEKITLSNTQGMSVELLSLGGIITKILVPDQNGHLENVVVGYRDLEDYLEDDAYFGALIGRTAGRISKAKFSLGDKIYALATNNGDNNLHGGPEGLHSKVWDATLFQNEKEVGVTLSTLSPDGEEGYPGNLEVKVTYTLNEENTLKLTYEGKSDADTLVNLTNHSYFNLSGDLKRPVTDQILQVYSDEVCALDADSIPTGNLTSVQVEPAFDFNEPKRIGLHIDDPSTRLQSGYDHPWILSKKGLVDVALYDEVSGRKLEVRTNQKAVVIYAMNFTDDTKYLCDGKLARTRRGICFETQGLPIGHGECFKEESVLKAGELYKQETYFTFSV